MIEVHLPHKLHGFWEFLLHLFTITVGLLIAVQIESCVESRHHLNLAAEARAALRLEIENNLNDFLQMKPGIKKWREEVDADLAAMQIIQEHPNDPKAQHVTLTISFSSISRFLSARVLEFGSKKSLLPSWPTTSRNALSALMFSNST